MAFRIRANIGVCINDLKSRLVIVISIVNVVVVTYDGMFIKHSVFFIFFSGICY
jgi:hypothetical protein